MLNCLKRKEKKRLISHTDLSVFYKIDPDLSLSWENLSLMNSCSSHTSQLVTRRSLNLFFNVTAVIKALHVASFSLAFLLHLL